MFMKWDPTRFCFQHGSPPPCNVHTPFISAAMLGGHWQRSFHPLAQNRHQQQIMVIVRNGITNDDDHDHDSDDVRRTAVVVEVVVMGDTGDIDDYDDDDFDDDDYGN